MTVVEGRSSLSNSGLSLIEGLIAIGVVLSLGALVLPQVLRYWQAYELDSATQALSSSLEIARYTALSKKCNVVVRFYAGSSWYEVFEDDNGNSVKDSGELSLGAYSLPRLVKFSGEGLEGPPASPSGPVSDPVTFAGDKVIFNPEGKISGGLGTIYLRNDAHDASALSFNLASRLKIYKWNKGNSTWN